MNIGALRHRVTLQTAGVDVPEPDGGGGFTNTPVILASRIPAAVAPATARSLERITANTVQSSATHLVTVRYLSGITTKSTLVYHDGTTDRPMSISGVHDPDERHEQLILECDEVVV